MFVFAAIFLFANILLEQLCERIKHWENLIIRWQVPLWVLDASRSLSRRTGNSTVRIRVVPKIQQYLKNKVPRMASCNDFIFIFIIKLLIAGILITEMQSWPG